jgi:hypothetical protein
MDLFRCSGIREGKTNPHSLPDRLTLDEAGDPILTGGPSEEEREAHEKWLAKSFDHQGFLRAVFPGYLARARNLRGFVKAARPTRSALSDSSGKGSLRRPPRWRLDSELAHQESDPVLGNGAGPDLPRLPL